MLFADFETAGIEQRPDYPPEPKGIALAVDNATPTYVRDFSRLRQLWDTQPMVFHNAGFDVAVAVEKLGLRMPGWQHIHDTQILAFLSDPYASTRLKDRAASELGIPPDEQDDIKEWIHANIPEAKRKTVNWGYWIASAPMHLLRKYAQGDITRTRGLFEHYASVRNDMADAYSRERRLLPMLLENSRRGVRVDARKLRKDLVIYEQALVRTDARVCKALGRTFNVGSPDELADALEQSGKGGGFLVTPKGKRSVSKKSLAQCELDPQVAELLNYRGRVETALTMFMRPWSAMVEQTGDRVHFNWSSTRSEKGGARTGRLSSSPNAQNIPTPKTFKADAPRGLPPLPFLRTYLLPDEGCVWVRFDYSQQELRILAHFEDGELMQMYRERPDVDVHQMVADLMGIDRVKAKTMGFALLYGMGLKELSERLGVSVDEARRLKAGYLRVLPGLKSLQKDIERSGRDGVPITTLGGRKYLAEPPKIVKGQLKTWEYKLLNYLVQGSSADYMKEALCRLYEANLPGRLLVDVHDEADWSVPKGKLKNTIKDIRHIMCSVPLDVPMLCEVETGPSWGELRAN